MKAFTILLMSLALAASCSSPSVERMERQEEAKKDYQEAMEESEEEFKEENLEEKQEEAEDMVEDSESIDIDKAEGEIEVDD